MSLKMIALRVNDLTEPPRIVSISCPNPAPGQIRVRIAACGLNFADLLIARGTYQDMPALPATLGLELAGTIDAVGPDVEGFEEGDRVAVFAGSGGLAEWGVFDARRAVRIPDAMPFDIAASFLVAYGTSHLALTSRARVVPGEKLAVLGSAGGVGLTAVEIGRHLGAEVIAVARGPHKLEISRAAGAHHVIDAETADLRQSLRALGGADVIYDAVGGTPMEEALRALRPMGRAIAVGFASGSIPKVRANHLLVKNIDLIGFYWGGYMNFAPDLLKDSLTELFDWYSAGHLSPHISQWFPLHDAEKALAALAERGTTGKVVVTMKAHSDAET